MFNDTRDAIKETTAPVVTFVFWAIVLMVTFSAVGLGIYWFSAPAQVAIENRTFHQSQPYNDGMARDLENLRLAYAEATTDGQRDAIRDTVRHRFAGYDTSRLSTDDRAFEQEMDR